MGCHCLNLHIFTLAQHHIVDIFVWNRLSIANIANLPNTQMLQLLFELPSVKETINYQPRNMESNV